MKPAIIVVEWVDAVGKTTLAKELAIKLWWEYQKSPIYRTSAEREYYDTPWISVQERFDFYLEASRDDINYVQWVCRQWSMAIMDRGITSTIIHHLLMEPTINLREAHEINKWFDRIQILLHANPNIIQNRLWARKNKTRFEEDLDLILRTQAKFRKCRNNLEIDTWNHTIEETLHIAHGYILDALAHKSQ